MKNLLFLFYFVTLSFAQDVSIHGIILNSNTNEEISNVNIYLADLTKGTISDKDGYFKLIISESSSAQIVFQHVAFDTLKLSIEESLNKKAFYLQPLLIETKKIIVEAKKGKSEMEKDLPQAITIIEAKEFEGGGYIDAGDFLRTQQGIQVEENLSGKKTISMRGGNPDDLGVYYNGVKMNSAYDGIFDFSLINLEDIEQIEVIKGSNTVLFGSEAFSGIINIVPKINKKYNARFTQKIGSYNSGEWNLMLNERFLDKFYASYNIKNSGSKRPFTADDGFLQNKGTHHLANVLYNLAEDKDGAESQNISLMYMHSELDYKNSKTAFGIDDLNRLISLQFIGDIGIVRDVKISTSFHQLNNKRSFVTKERFVRQQGLTDTYYLTLQKKFTVGNYNLLAGYQYENSNLKLAEDSTRRNGIEKASISREKHAAIGIFKFLTPSGSDFLNTDINISYRFDYVENQQNELLFRNTMPEVIGNFDAEKNWSTQTLKFATQLKSSSKNFRYSFFFNAGKNSKFPTIFQLLSVPSEIDINNPQIVANLNPEKNNSLDFGLELISEKSILNAVEQWQFNFNYFNSLFENKVRTFYQYGSGYAVYDNYPNAKISGIEYTFRTYLKNKFALEIANSHLVISEKVAFPFKSDEKYTLRILYDDRGYSAKLNWFYENEQIAWVSVSDGGFAEVELPGFMNMDFHFSKKIEYYKFNYLFSLSIRNILSDDTILEGIALRDRRYYLGVSVEY